MPDIGQNGGVSNAVAAQTNGGYCARAPTQRALDQPRLVSGGAAANEEWSADFKGWFRTRDQSRIDPLTIADGHSRFLIPVCITPPTLAGVQPVFTAAFRAHGLRERSGATMGGRSGRAGPAG